MTDAREPGSPVLLIEGAELEQFLDADALARRLHQLRGKGGLDVTAGHASTGGPDFAGVLVWLTGPRRYLAFTAGPGADTPAELLAALSRTRTRASVAA